MWGASVSLTERSAALRLVVCAALAAAVAWSQSADTWTIETIAGTGTRGYSGDGGAATAARLNLPVGVAVDNAGNVYIADNGNHRIRKVDGSGNISTFAGTGTRGYSGDGGAATAAQLGIPESVAVDNAGNVYIADRFNNRIRKVDGSGNISTFAGTGTRGYSGDGGAATAAQLSSPSGVALDNAGNVYIADYNNHRIRKVDGSGNISTFAGTGTRGFSGDGGAATAARLNIPTNVAVDDAGNVYIADSRNDRIRKVDGSGNISTFAGMEAQGYNGDGGAATAARLSLPLGVAVDDAGNVYIADWGNYRIRKVDGSGNISTFAGTGTAGYSGDGGAATAAQLRAPTGVAVDGSGNVYIGDAWNDRIRKVTRQTPAPSITASPPTLSFTLPQGATTQSEQVVLTAGPGGANFTATSAQNWLTAQPNSGSLNAGESKTITVTANPASLTADTYSGQLSIAVTGGVAVQVAVSLTVTPPPSITPSPATLSFTLPQGITTRSEQVVLTAGPGGADFTVISNQNWLTAQPNSGSLDAGESETITVTANPAGLTAGPHRGQLSIAVSGGVAVQVAVSLTVTPPPSITPSPTRLSFTLPQGATARSEQVVLTAGPGGANFTATSAQNWLTAQPNSGSLNAGESKTITVTANPASLTADTYSGQLSIAVSGGVAVQVAVSLTVTPPPSITPSPTRLSFTLPQGATARSEQVVLTAGPGGANFTVISNQNWLTAQPNSGSLNAGESETITVTANPAGLTAKAYSGQLSIAVSGATATQVVNVSLTVTPPPSITRSPTRLSFTLPQGAAAQSKQVVLTAGPGGADFIVTSAQNWLTAQPNSGSLNAGESRTITVTANPAGLTARAYSGQLSIAVSGATATQVVNVSLTVQPPASITASPSTLSFTLPQGAAAQNKQVVLTAGPGGANFIVTSAQNWLTAQPNSGSLNADESRTITVTANPAGLTARAYSGQLSIAVSGATATQVVNVSLTVQPPASITASPTTLSFTLPQGATTRSEQVVLTAGPGGANFIVTSAQNWLTAQPNSGSLNAGESRTITVTANPTGLTARAYSGQLSIAVSGATATQVVTVSLTVQPPASITVSPATLSFTLPQGAAAQSKQVFLTAGPGGANFTVTVTPDQSWLTALPNSGSLDAGEPEPLTVTANPAGLTAGPQSGQLSIAVSGGAPTQVAVSLNVTAAAVVWTIDTIAGTGTRGFSGDGGAATAAQLSVPSGVAVDGAGNLYIADSLNHRIRKVDAAGLISTVAGSGTPGFGGDSGPARQAQFALPSSVAADSLGNLYIADTFNHRIRRVDAATGIVDTVTGNGTSGFGGDDGPALQAQLDRPYGVALDSSGNLYIADSFNHRIRKVDAAGLISTVAGNGTSGFGGDGRAALQAQLNNPVGVATDSSGNLYIADSDNHRIRKVDAAGLISTAAGNGTSGFSGDGSSALQAQLDNPVGVAADGAGNLYISDWGNQRIRRVDAATGLVATIAGNGTLGFGGDDGPGTAALLAFPRGLAVDVSGNLYIADTLNNRIRRLTGGMPRISPGGIILGAGRPVVDRISPNAIVSVFGHDLAPPGRRTLTLDPAGLIAANLASTCLEIDGKRAPLFFVSPTQINAQVPHDLTVTAEQTTAVVVRGCGTTSERRSAAATVAVGTVSPAFFNWVNNTDGRNPLIALHGGGPDLVGAPGLLPGVQFTPAEPGKFVTLFGTGFGATEPPLATGEIPGTAVTFNLANAVAFTFGGIAVPPEDVFYAGASPCCAGLYQFTVRLPANLPDGDATVTAVVQGVSTPQGPFLSVRRR